MTPPEIDKSIRKMDAALGFIAGIMLGGLVGHECGTPPKDCTYKQGQIDALTGDIRYHLVEHADGTMTWGDIEACTSKEQSDE